MHEWPPPRRPFFFAVRLISGTYLHAFGVHSFSGGDMFSESLLDSSTRVRKVRRWPMATAFMLEVTAATVAVVLPLVTTNVLPARAHDVLTTPLRSVPMAQRNSNSSSRATTNSTATMVVQLAEHPNAVSFGPLSNATEPAPIAPGGVGTSEGIPSGLMDGNYVPPQPPAPEHPRRISVLSEAMLVKKVEPIYPHIAAVAGISGTVKLHAIIGTDGSVEDLNVVAGHPLLADAALDAVRQWHYKPYVLNGRPIEVETFITVVFRKPGQ
jgi:protein TonB